MPPRSSRPPFPSAPSEPNLRRLGVGAGTGGDRPLRAQLVVAAVVVLMLLAVPLYLLRRPGAAHESDARALDSARASVSAEIAAVAASSQAALKLDPVRLGAVQRVKCSAAPQAKGQEGALCDALPSVEASLMKAIRESTDCAPKANEEGTINYVLNVDFAKQRLNLFPGVSGSWKGKQAKRAVQCVFRSMPAPDWDAMRHQYRYYTVAVMATYPAPGADRNPLAPPTFE